jgi:hypothetical protein
MKATNVPRLYVATRADMIRFFVGGILLGAALTLLLLV